MMKFAVCVENLVIDNMHAPLGIPLLRAMWFVGYVVMVATPLLIVR
jgi:hypothetical protein